MVHHARSLFCISLLLAASTEVHAQAPQSADYHYQGNLWINPETGLIKADWKIDVLDVQATGATFVLRNTITDVTVNGVGVQSSDVGSVDGLEDFTAITLVFDPAVANRAVHMSYAGVLIPEPMENLINAIEPGRVELNVDSFWFPIDLSFSKTLSAEVDVLVGEGWEGVTTGRAEPIEGGMRIINTDPRIDIAFTLSKSFNITKAKGYIIYDQREPSGEVDQLVTVAGQCREFLDSRFGQIDPLPVSRLLIAQRPSSGYARENYIVFNDITKTSPEALTQFVCHEFAHYWARGGKFDTVDNWINESFAEYLGAMAVREYFGQEAYKTRLDSMREQVAGEELPPIWTPGATARGPYLVNYRKGPLALAQLERQLGQETFMAFAQALFSHDDKSTPMLLDVLEEVAGTEQRAVFQTQLAQ